MLTGAPASCSSGKCRIARPPDLKAQFLSDSEVLPIRGALRRHIADSTALFERRNAGGWRQQEDAGPLAPTWSNRGIPGCAISANVIPAFNCRALL
jgi:hypothetical protein